MRRSAFLFRFLIPLFVFALAFSFSACSSVVSEQNESVFFPDLSENPGPPLPTALPTADPNAKYIALTFDDGPVNGKTSRLLSILEEKGVKATFFLLGISAETYPNIVKAIDSAGHEIGNHTYDHTVLTGKNVTYEDIEYQIDHTNTILYELTGKTPLSFRPPQGSYNTAVRSVAKSRELAIYHWSYQSCPEDWKNKDPDVIKKIVLENASRGHIVLLHDMHDHTLEALPDIIDGLKERDFRFVTITELISLGPDQAPIPGKVYFYYNTPTKD
jgi:peptidoglycan-N-acetylglucosamine deacetylase